MKLNLSKRVIKELVFPGLIIAVGIIAIIFVIVSQLNSISESRISIQRLTAENEELRSKYLILSSLEEGNIERQAALAELAVPSEKNIPYILQSFREAVADPGFIIIRFRFAPGEVVKDVEDTGRVEELPLSANLVGPTDNLNQLLDRLERSFPLFEVKSINSNVVPDQIHKTRVEIQLTTYHTPPLIELVREDIPLEELNLTEEESLLLDDLAGYYRPELRRRTIREIKRASEDPFSL